MTTLVEGFDPDQIALARHLAGSGASGLVRLAGPGPAPAEALALTAAHGVSVEAHADLDADPGPVDTAYLDVLTPDVAPRVRELRARGARVTCLRDLLLERARGLTIGITGTAGKTIAATIARQLLAAAGIPVAASTSGRLGNVWPAAELLERSDAAPAGREPPTALVFSPMFPVGAADRERFSTYVCGRQAGVGLREATA